MSNPKNILITGTSSGIGRYVVEVLTARGHFVFAGYRNPQDAEEIKKINPDKIQPVMIDVTNDESIRRAKEEIAKSGRPLDVLFNNAGLALGGPLETLKIDDIKKLYEVNFFGYVRMIQNFLPLLRLSQGRIINISSISGLFTIPFTIPYSTSKHAVEALADGLRRELRAQKIKVVLIEPGSIKTPIWKKSANWWEEIVKLSPEILSHYQPAITNFIKLFRSKAAHASELNKLKSALIRAVEKANPRARYQAYFTNRLTALLVKFLPVKFMDWLFGRLLN
jgi:NAD(P)-dependent dehydrogenase (short-subunit alcohol dehydrogenase family)